MTTKHTSECDRQRHNGVRWSPAPLLPHIWAPSCILMICCSLISPMRYDTIQSDPIQSHLDGLLPMTPHGYFFLFFDTAKVEHYGILHRREVGDPA